MIKFRNGVLEFGFNFRGPGWLGRLLARRIIGNRGSWLASGRTVSREYSSANRVVSAQVVVVPEPPK